MVTVSLSDIQSSSEHTQPDWRTLNIPPTPVQATHEPEAIKSKTESFGPMALLDAARTTATPVDEPPAPTSADPRHVGAGQTGEEVDSELDWENLDRTEEREPRGEGSDDVG